MSALLDQLMQAAVYQLPQAEKEALLLPRLNELTHWHDQHCEPFHHLIQATQAPLQAKDYGDILVVGVDSDRGIKSYKGDLRPIIPQSERIEMLTYQGCVDYVTLIDDIDNKGAWQYELIKQVPMDTFVAVEADSYPQEEIDMIKKYCPEIKAIPRQAMQTSTTDIIQNVLKTHLLDMVSRLSGK